MPTHVQRFCFWVITAIMYAGGQAESVNRPLSMPRCGFVCLPYQLRCGFDSKSQSQIPYTGFLRLRGGGRLPASEKRWRRKQAEEQLKTGIGKSMWRREKSGVSKNDKLKEVIAGFRKTKDKLESNYSRTSRAEEIGQTAKKNVERANVDELTKLEEDAKALLEQVRKEKGAALRQKHLGKKDRKKQMRAEANYDNPTNWKSMM